MYNLLNLITVIGQNMMDVGQISVSVRWPKLLIEVYQYWQKLKSVPPKPNPNILANAYYNIDFSLQHQSRLATAAGTVALTPTNHESGSLSKQSSLDAGSNTSLGIFIFSCCVFVI